MAEELDWFTAVWIGSTADSMRSITAFFTTFVAIRALWGEGWSYAEFACRGGHRAYPHRSFCSRGACVLATAVATSAAAALGCIYNIISSREA